MKTIKYIFLSATLIGITACNPDDTYDVNVEPLPALTAGSVDFSKYVAVGASFTAGYADGAMFLAGQLKHARGMSAVLAPTANSYKRLVPGYEAPVTALEMAKYIKDFPLKGHHLYNGKLLQVSNSTP